MVVRLLNHIMKHLHLQIFWVFIAVFIVRILLSLLPSYEIDLRGWRFWADRMATSGPAHFYSREIFTDNPPGFLYVFWAVGEIQKNFFPNINYGTPISDLLIKLPTNIADLLTGLIIYKIVRRYKSKSIALAAFLFYTLNPAIFFNSSVMGQFDGSATLFILLSIYLLTFCKSPFLSTVSFAIAWAIKPQAIMIAPFIALLVLKKTKPSQWLVAMLTLIVTTLIIYLPFFPNNPIYGIYYVNKAMTEIFTCTSCFTFNFWGIFGNWGNDLIKFLNLPLIYWGIILMLLSFIPIFFLKPFSKKFTEPYLYFTAALSVMSAFTFLTRMHERYIFPFFALFVISAFLIKSKKLLLFYIIFSLFNFINLYFPYAYYNNQLHLTPGFVDILFAKFSLLSALGSLLFLILLKIYLEIISNKNETKSK